MKPWWTFVRVPASTRRYWRIILARPRTFYVCSLHWFGEHCVWHGPPPPNFWPTELRWGNWGNP